MKTKIEFIFLFYIDFLIDNLSGIQLKNIPLYLFKNFNFINRN